MSTAPESIEMTVLTDEELDDVVSTILAEAHTDLETLRRQAQLGRFESDRHRRAWFVLAGLGRDRVQENQDKRPYFTGQAKWYDAYWEASIRLHAPGTRGFNERIVETAYFDGMNAKANAIAWVDNYGERLQDAIAVFGDVGTIDDYVTEKVYIND